MKMIVQIMILAAAACSIASGFSFPQMKCSSAKTSLNAVDVVGLDPSVADPNILTAAGAAVAAAFTAAIGLNSKNARSDIVKNPSKPEPTIDVSIPYNAAALLAYNAVMKVPRRKLLLMTSKLYTRRKWLQKSRSRFNNETLLMS